MVGRGNILCFPDSYEESEDNMITSTIYWKQQGLHFTSFCFSSRYARKALRGASKNDASARIDELVSSKRSDIQLGLDCIARGKDVDLDDLDLGEEYKHFSGLSLGTQVC